MDQSPKPGLASSDNCPLLADFEHNATTGKMSGRAVMYKSACHSRAKQHTGRIHKQLRLRLPTVCAPGEAVQKSFGPRAARALGQLKHNSVVGSATMKSGAVEVARRVERHAREGRIAVGAGKEGMQHVLSPIAIPAGQQFIHQAATAAKIASGKVAAIRRRTVEIAGCVEDEVPRWPKPIRPVKTKEYGLYPLPAVIERQFVHHAASDAFRTANSVLVAAVRHSVKIADLIGN